MKRRKRSYLREGVRQKERRKAVVEARQRETQRKLGLELKKNRIGGCRVVYRCGVVILLNKKRREKQRCALCN